AAARRGRSDRPRGRGRRAPLCRGLHELPAPDLRRRADHPRWPVRSGAGRAHPGEAGRPGLRLSRPPRPRSRDRHGALTLPEPSRTPSRTVRSPLLALRSMRGLRIVATLVALLLVWLVAYPNLFVVIDSLR